VWRGEKEEEEGVAWREGRKRKRKKMREVIMMIVSAGVKRRKERKKKKRERYLVYWGLFYFDAIFKLKLSCHLRIGYYKSWILQPIRIEVKFPLKYY
jgi:hypothetical protein